MGNRESKQRLNTKIVVRYLLETDKTEFKKMGLNPQTHKTLTQYSGYSKDTFQRTFYAFLEESTMMKII